MEYRFLFSVVMPLYNLEKYAEESILSVVGQSIGFENIQLILVNDGSRDGTGDICRKYADLYPDNVKYICQENAGVSAARNSGMRFIEGKYVNFFDGDDIWPKDAFEKVYEFYKAHEGEIDCVSCRQVFFEAWTKYHYLDFRYRAGTRIIDIHKEPACTQRSVSNLFIAESCLHGKSFDENLSINEDAKFAAEVVLEKEKYGVIKDVEYRLRKRDDGTSATQNMKINKSFYTDSVSDFYKFMCDYSMNKYGRIIPYVQYCILYGVKPRITEELPEILNEEETTEYISAIKKLIAKFDDDVLLKIRNAALGLRLYMVSMKSNDAINRVLGNKELVSELLSAGKTVQLRNASLNTEEMIIKGVFNQPFCFDKYRIYAVSGDKKYDAAYKENEKVYSFVGDLISTKYEFNVEIPLDAAILGVTFYLDADGTLVKLPVNAFKLLDDDVILNVKKAKWWEKINILNKKYGNKAAEKLYIKKDGLYYKECKLAGLKNPSLIKINSIDISDSQMHLTGNTRLAGLRRYDIYLRTNGKKLIPLKISGSDFTKESEFETDLKLSGVRTLSFVIRKKTSKKYYLLTPAIDSSSKINRKLKNSYFVQGKYIVAADDKKLLIEKYGRRNHLNHEKKLIQELLRKKRFKAAVKRLMVFAKIVFSKNK